MLIYVKIVKITNKEHTTNPPPPNVTKKVYELLSTSHNLLTILFVLSREQNDLPPTRVIENTRIKPRGNRRRAHLHLRTRQIN